MGTMPSRSGSTLDARAATQVWVDSLGDLPSEDVAATLRKFRLGKLGDGHWAPTPAEVRRAVEEELTARQRRESREREFAEQFEARRRLKERQEEFITPETKARVQAMASEFCKPAEKRADWIGTEAECDAKLAEKAAGRWYREPLTVSQELVAQLRGEAPIGEGKLGAYPLAQKQPEAAE